MMMEKYIGKVKLNLEFYKGSDPESDKELESKLLSIVKSGQDIEEYLTSESDGRILYQLSDIRKNLLRWYTFDKNARLLEIGSGCGTLTGLFCERCAFVTAIEPSKTRCEINAYRNNYDNLDIIAGCLNDISLNEKYDIVTLIGSLKLSENLISAAKTMLKPGGTIIVATANKYGLKYWSGASDEETGTVFSYSDEQACVNCFSKNGLTKILTELDINNIEFYYPVPDHRLPLYIYTEESLPESGLINTETVEYVKEGLKLFNERKVSDELLKDGMYPDFANSYLVIGSV